MKTIILNQPATVSMKPDLNTLLIFKTNILTDEAFGAIHPLFEKHPAITDWSIDRDDRDCVLRVFTEKLTPADIILLIGNEGFFCAELD